MFATRGRKMLFCLVDLKVEECQEIHNLIVNNGGRVVNYQDHDVMVLANRYHSDISRTFHVNFVRDCVSKRCIVDMMPYMLGPEKYMCLVSLYLYGKTTCHTNCTNASVQTCHTSTDDNLFGKNCATNSMLTIGNDYEVPGIECQSQEFPQYHESCALEIKPSTSQLDRNSSSTPVQTETRFRSHIGTNRKANSPVSDAETIVIDKSGKGKKSMQKQPNSTPDRIRAFFEIPSTSGMQTRSNAVKNLANLDYLSNDITVIDDSDESDEPMLIRNPCQRFPTEQDSSSSNCKTKRNVMCLKNAAGRQKSKAVKDESAAMDSAEQMEVDPAAVSRCTKPVTINSWISRGNSDPKTTNLSPRDKLTETNNTARPKQLKREINKDKSKSFPFKRKSQLSKPVNKVFPSPPKTSRTRKVSTDLEDLSDSATDTEKPSTSKTSGVSKKSQKSAVVKTKATQKTETAIEKKKSSAKKMALWNSSSDETDFEIDQEQSDAAEEGETPVVEPEDVVEPQTAEEDHSPRPPITRNIAPWEQKQMIKYLIDTRQIHLAKGNSVWAALISTKQLKHRTIHSLNNNFRRSILPNIKMFVMPGKHRDKFLSLC